MTSTVDDGAEDDAIFADLFASSTLNSTFAAKALLQIQYLPHVKKSGEELPPLFSTASFSLEAAELVGTVGPESANWVELRTRRFDGLVRRLGIPHPVPYARLVLHIRENWDQLASKLGGSKSQIRPEWHGDGRIIQMDYVDHSSEHNKQTLLAQGNSYLVKADISNCFPSVYSHALDWALRGKPAAKAWAAMKKRPPSWEATLDFLARNCVNKETKGLLIGPAVSNVLSELLLQRIDEELANYSYVRFIDDYSAHFPTREKAERFLVLLQRALAKYRLDLNTRKTRIVSLREGIGDAWMADVQSHLPADSSELSAARFLRQAELLALRYPDQSVLKFAAKTLLGRDDRTSTGSMLVVNELVRIAQFHPHLLSVLNREIVKLGETSKDERERLAKLLRQQIVGAIRGAETDSLLWLLFIIKTQLVRPLKLNKSVVRKLLRLDDDLVWLAVARFSPKHADGVQSHVRDLEYHDESDRQAHWLARYELWRVGRLDVVPREVVNAG